MQNSQGGGDNGWGGSPWGSGGNGGGLDNRSPPDIEELIRRGQEKLNSIFPRGGSGGFLFIIGAILILLFWLSQAVYQVSPEERGVEFVFGKPGEQLSEPGLHFIAWPMEKVELVNIEQRRDMIGPVGTSKGLESLMLSGDQNIVDVVFTVLWRVVEPADFLISVVNQRDLIRRASESAMREYIGRSRGEAVRTTRREELEEGVRSQLQAVLDLYRMGIRIDGIQLERADPPREVADAFEEVQRAQQDQEKYKQEAQAYANKLFGDANGHASRVREEAKGYKDRVVSEARGESQRFISIYDQYRKAKNVTRRRLYLETMERVLGKADKFIVEDGVSGSGVIPYLPLSGSQQAGSKGVASQ
ncbi:MAG: FtsH protease activity modulator HflK [Alphaproteobacteria bacterium]|nr:FtsH protease activity modulator HflK [Alphaproteobacteria bacterium]